MKTKFNNYFPGEENNAYFKNRTLTPRQVAELLSKDKIIDKKDGENTYTREIGGEYLDKVAYGCSSSAYDAGVSKKVR